MGLQIKRNGDGLYNMLSSISGERLHDAEWVTEDEAKKVLMDIEVYNFLEKMVEIDMDFPNAYSVNGVWGRDRAKFSRWSLDAMHEEGTSYFETLVGKFGEVRDRLTLDYDLIIGKEA
jgi:hypothetical protein